MQFFSNFAAFLKAITRLNSNYKMQARREVRLHRFFIPFT